MTAPQAHLSAEDDAGHHGEVLIRWVARGVAVGIPLAIVAVTLGLWLFTDADLATAFATAILPAVLVGVFFGGFAGMVAAEF
jgi:hypothetical protein